MQHSQVGADVSENDSAPLGRWEGARGGAGDTCGARRTLGLLRGGRAVLLVFALGDVPRGRGEGLGVQLVAHVCARGEG